MSLVFLVCDADTLKFTTVSGLRRLSCGSGHHGWVWDFVFENCRIQWATLTVAQEVFNHHAHKNCEKRQRLSFVQCLCEKLSDLQIFFGKIWLWSQFCTVCTQCEKCGFALGQEWFLTWCLCSQGQQRAGLGLSGLPAPLTGSNSWAMHHLDSHAIEVDWCWEAKFHHNPTRVLTSDKCKDSVEISINEMGVLKSGLCAEELESCGKLAIFQCFSHTHSKTQWKHSDRELSEEKVNHCFLSVCTRAWWKRWFERVWWVRIIFLGNNSTSIHNSAVYNNAFKTCHFVVHQNDAAFRLLWKFIICSS